jgi:hypothetical protein
MATAPCGQILCAFAEPGYLRFYGSTVRELVSRGWRVGLVFDRPEKRGGLAVDSTGPLANLDLLGALPRLDKPGGLATLRNVLDYLRYLEPAYSEAAYLRRRTERILPASWRFLTRLPGVPQWTAGAAIRGMRALEDVLAPDPSAVDLLKSVAPDVVLVSPLVIAGPGGHPQTELIKAARRLGIPVMIGVASWDHLTSKGLIRVLPDAIAVWNERQASEAVRLHRVPRSRIVVTGAQSLDHWFAAPGRPAQLLRQELDIPADRRVLLFAGSSRNMAPGDSEVQFFRRWLAAIRASSHPAVRDAFVIVRPHPGNTQAWTGVDFRGCGAVVHPSSYSGIPLRDDEVETFRSSMLISDAVIGINTTGLIEAAILQRPVLTVLDESFRHSQRETLHFQHLTVDAGGFVVVDDDLSAHVESLARVLTDPAVELSACREFVRSFVRPRDVNEPATGHLCDAIEQLARTRRPAPQRRHGVA